MVNAIKGALSVLLATLGALLILAPVANQVVRLRSLAGTEVILALAFVIVLVLRVASATTLSHLRRTSRSTVSPAGVGDDYIRETEQAARASFPKAHRDALSKSLAYGNVNTTRVSERVVFSQPHLHYKKTHVVSTPTKGPVIVRVTTLEKNTLLDNFTVDVNGKPHSTLTTHDSHGLLSSLLSDLFFACFLENQELSSEQETERKKLLRKVKRAVCSDHATDISSTLKRIDDLPAIYSVETSQEQGPQTQDKLDTLSDQRLMFLQVANQASQESFIFIQFKDLSTSRTRITVEFDKPSTETLKGPFAYLRSVLGLAGRVYIHRLSDATAASSYHFQAEAPASMYVYRAVPVSWARPTSNFARPAPDNHETQPALQLSETLGSDYVHLHGRDLDDNVSSLLKRIWPLEVSSSAVSTGASGTPVGLGLRLEFRERPPGLLGVILVVSVLLTVLVWVVGKDYDHFFGTSKIAPLATPRVTLLLGFPAIAAGWLVSRVTEDVLQRISLPTFAVMWWFILNSVWALGLAATNNGYDPSTNGRSSGRLVEILHPGWAALMLSTGVCLGVELVFLFSKLMRYWIRMNGRVRIMPNLV